MIVHDDALCTLHLGDCVEVMRELPAESVDAIVTDPPYGLEFMGKEWDRLGATIEATDDTVWPDRAPGASLPFGGGGQRVRYGKSAKTMQTWHEAWAREAFRVAKPGAHLLAFGGTRTYHRLASAIEDAGWEIRDCLVWAYASGFPKSLDVSKAIDKAAGAERTVATGASYRVPNAATVNPHFIGIAGQRAEGEREIEYAPTAPATPDAQKWDGWGTALKPAWEPIVMARKPLSGTVAANVLAHGTGALNIDATRIGTDGGSAGAGAGARVYGDGLNGTRAMPVDGMGRWPANLILTDPIFDGDTPGVVGGGTQESTAQPGAWQPRGAFPIDNPTPTIYGDSGTYSRFFLIPKASRSDREPLVRGSVDEYEHSGPRGHTRNGDGTERLPSRPRANLHPTVKPLELMRHLVRLVTPPGGTVLDCFLGSGTTAIAANQEGFRAIGIEKEREYLDIALGRMLHQKVGIGL